MAASCRPLRRAAARPSCARVVRHGATVATGSVPRRGGDVGVMSPRGWLAIKSMQDLKRRGYSGHFANYRRRTCQY
jgi:hypothetical protein